jgi:hypothetical protein
VSSEASAQTSLEAARQSVEDRATTAQTAAATEQDSLASRLALTEADVEQLRAAATSAEEAAERAKTNAAATETAARDATQADAREKVTLKAKVSELERDLGTAGLGDGRSPVPPGHKPTPGGIRGGDVPV